jgi:PAS domain S-box-containing protein
MELSAQFLIEWVRPGKVPFKLDWNTLKFREKINGKNILERVKIELPELCHTLPDLYLFLSPDFTILEATDEYLKATLTKRENIIGRNIFNVFPDNPDSSASNATRNLRSSLLAVLRTKKPQSMPLQHYDIPDPRGGFREKHWHPLNSPVLDESGNIIYIIHKVTDVTAEVLMERENKKNKIFAQKTMEEHSELLRVLETIPQMAWTHLPDGKINYINEKWLNYTGQNLKETVNGGWISILHPEDQKKIFEGLKHSLKTGKKFQSETRLRRTDGKYHWHLILEKAIRDENGNIIMWVGTATDIQQQKIINERKDEFIGIASHELKSPLTSLKAYIQLLERSINKSSDETSKTFIHKTNAYISRLNNLVEDLLDVSKIQSGKLSFDITHFKLGELLSDSLESLKITNSNHQVQVEGDSETIIAGDRFRLEQVFTNFLSNAIKYSPDSNKVIINITKDNGFIKIAVTDFGIGIPQKKISQLFQRFSRVESESRKFHGLGLGLYISAEIIRRHGGKVGVESEQGKGSTFYFTLPLKKAA